jgi:hypothetical protein
VRGRKETDLSDIPEELLDKMTAGFASEGAKVEKPPQPDGKWTVVALFARDDQRRPAMEGCLQVLGSPQTADQPPLARTTGSTSWITMSTRRFC